MQGIYGAYTENEKDYTITYPALVTYSVKTGKKYTLPFSLKSTNFYDYSKRSVTGSLDFFDWSKAVTEEVPVVTKTPNHTQCKKGIIQFDPFPGYQYMMFPVNEHMMDHLFEFIQHELNIDTRTVLRIHETYTNKITFTLDGHTFTIEHGKYGDDLAFYEEANTAYDLNRVVITKVGVGFNALLRKGNFQEEFK